MAKRDIVNDPSVRSLAEEIFVHLCDLGPDEQRQTMEELGGLFHGAYHDKIKRHKDQIKELEKQWDVFIGKEVGPSLYEANALNDCLDQFKRQDSTE